MDDEPHPDERPPPVVEDSRQRIARYCGQAALCVTGLGEILGATHSNSLAVAARLFAVTLRVAEQALRHRTR